MVQHSRRRGAATPPIDTARRPSSSRPFSFVYGARHSFRDLLYPPLAHGLLPPPSSRPRRSTRKVRRRTAASLVPARRFGSAQGASPAFEPEPAVPSGQPSRRRRRLTPHNHAVPVVINPLRARLAHRPTAKSSPPDPRAPSRAPTSSTFLRGESRSHTASWGEPGLAPPQQDAVLLSGLLVPGASTSSAVESPTISRAARHRIGIVVGMMR